MVFLHFNDFYFILCPILLLINIWILFFKVNSNFIKTTKEKVLNVNVLKLNSNTLFVEYYYYLIFFSVFSLYTLRGKNGIMWFNHLNFSNFTLNLLFLFLLLSACLYFLVKNTTRNHNLVKSLDYLFSINNLIILLPYIFFVNTVFTFLFLLELISVFLFYKLVSSKIWFKNLQQNTNLVNNIPQHYINMVFFQYWVTFFSTIFIVYFYINVFYLYGTSEWCLLQFLIQQNFENSLLTGINIRFLLCIFILSVVFKLGITPLHLFKVEVYKGIPLLSIFFYTTYFFSVLFIFFLYLLSDFFGLFVIYYWNFLTLLLFFGSLYVIVLLFDVNFLKAFFTYSTVINTIGFLITFLCTL